jgi:hypothetical protein
MEATGIEDVKLEIWKRMFRWIGHTRRKDDGKIPNSALQWNTQENRNRGRLKNS